MRKVRETLYAMAIMASMAETRDYLRGIESPPRIETPEWKRKKCKSCCHFGMAYQMCSKNPNNKACYKYHKRKN